jgi:hypothetical protein
LGEIFEKKTQQNFWEFYDELSVDESIDQKKISTKGKKFSKNFTEVLNILRIFLIFKFNLLGERKLILNKKKPFKGPFFPPKKQRKKSWQFLEGSFTYYVTLKGV